MQLRDDAGSLGLLILQRRWSDCPFSTAERSQLAALSPFVSGIASLQAGRADAQCEATLQRALGQGPGVLWLIDELAKEIVWTPPSSVDTRTPSPSVLERLLTHGNGQLSSSSDERWDDSAEAQLSSLASGSAPFAQQAMALRWLEVGHNGAEQGLSTRERAVARLLVRGYEAINIGANLGIAENTVRTYIRRLYRKLGACNRADLVRILLANDMG